MPGLKSRTLIDAALASAAVGGGFWLFAGVPLQQSLMIGAVAAGTQVLVSRAARTGSRVGDMLLPVVAAQGALVATGLRPAVTVTDTVILLTGPLVTGALAGLALSAVRETRPSTAVASGQR